MLHFLSILLIHSFFEIFRNAIGAVRFYKIYTTISDSLSRSNRFKDKILIRLKTHNDCKLSNCRKEFLYYSDLHDIT